MNNHKQVIQKRKQREKKQRIESILAAAKKVFYSKGYFKATMDQIALEAEISKPTIYQHFQNKDALFFALMAPQIDEVGTHLALFVKKVQDGEYTKGADLIRDLLDALYQCVASDLDTFRVTLLFQQGGLIGQFKPEIREQLNERGSRNFFLGREIARMGIEQGLLKQANINDVQDIIWGLFAALIQIDGIKAQYRPEKSYLKSNLELAKRVLAEGLVAE